MYKFKFRIIKNPSKSLDKKELHRLEEEVSSLVEKSWGRFDKSYIKHSILDSYLICLTSINGKIIGVAPLKKMNIFGSEIFSFGLTVVDPNFRGKHLLDKMSFQLGKRVLLENMLKFKFSYELIFITPNIRTLGTISKIATFIYPDPFKMDNNGKIPKADEDTWKRVREFLRISGEKYRKLEREGSIMEGFYDDKKELAYSEIEHDDKYLDLFGKKYIYTTPGREVVVRAIISAWKILWY